MWYIPIHIKSKVSKEYLQLVKFVVDKCELRDYYNNREFNIIYTVESTVTEVLDYTGWNAVELLNYSGWDGKEGLELYFVKSKRVELELTSFYIGRETTYRDTTSTTHWFHQIIPDFANDKITFAFVAAMGNVYKHFAQLIDATSDIPFFKQDVLYCEVEHEIKEKDEGLLIDHYVMRIKEGNWLFLKHKKFSNAGISIPEIAFQGVADEIKSYMEARSLWGNYD